MKKNDDFDWLLYTNDYYIKQIEQMQKEGTKFVLNKSRVRDGKINFSENVHPHAMVLYNEILYYKPQSVFECGCGPGYHLYNIKTLFPHIQVSGCELSDLQVNIGAKKLNIPESITNKIHIGDFCNYVSDTMYDFVYTNAVIMHITFDKAHLFLKNMKNMSLKYIRIAEDTGQHDFLKLFETTGITADFDIEQKFNGFLLRRK